MKMEKPEERIMDEGRHAYRSNSWWKDHVQKGDIVSLEWEDLIGDKYEKSLVFDGIRTWDDGLVPNFMLIFQESADNLGRKDICVPIVPANIKRLISLGDEVFKVGKKFKIKDVDEKPIPEPQKEPEKAGIVKTVKTRIHKEKKEEDSHPVVLEEKASEIKNNPEKKQRYRILCTCGKEYGDGAWYIHRKKAGKEGHEIKDKYIKKDRE